MSWRQSVQTQASIKQCQCFRFKYLPNANFITGLCQVSRRRLVGTPYLESVHSVPWWQGSIYHRLQMQWHTEFFSHARQRIKLLFSSAQRNFIILENFQLLKPSGGSLRTAQKLIARPLCACTGLYETETVVHSHTLNGIRTHDLSVRAATVIGWTHSSTSFILHDFRQDTGRRTEWQEVSKRGDMNEFLNKY
jgi:hypothetical protein